MHRPSPFFFSAHGLRPSFFTGALFFAASCPIPVFAADSLAFSLRGQVTDVATQTPLAGVALRLQISGLTATSDAQGNFLLGASSALAPGVDAGSERRLLPGEAGFLPRFFQAAAGPVRLTVGNPQGRVLALLHDGALGAGSHAVRLPSLPPGVYFLEARAGGYREQVRILALATKGSGGKGVDGRVAAHSTDADRRRVGAKSAAEALDTLIAEKAGYKTLKVPVPAAQQSGMQLALEAVGSGSETKTLIPDPSWTCFMPNGIPPPELGTEVFTLTLKYSALHRVGVTKFGDRRQYDITGGTLAGARLNANVVTGGLDYELVLSNGSVEVEQIVILRAADNAPILMRNAGISPDAATPVRTVLDFEAPNSSAHTWLHTGKFVARRVIDTAAKSIVLKVFDVSQAQNPAESVKISDPAGVTNQTWECVTGSGSQGAVVFSENVSLGSSISIGATKRGSRNIIPITGGTTTGQVVGKILPGGADYQLGGLDARYTLAPDDGEFILVRNCGAGALIPVFEARVDGPYDFLNENKYLSSAPGIGGGGVSITFYEKR